MGKFFLPALFLLLALWIFGGSWWYADRYYQASTIPYSISPTQDSGDQTAKLEETQGQTPIIIQPSNILFKDKKYDVQLTPELEHYFDQLKLYLDKMSDSQVIITGYTDNQGRQRDNLKLSRKRAMSVRKFMLNLGFNDQQLVTKYHGSKDPVESNQTEEGRSKNRRVEIRIK